MCHGMADGDHMLSAFVEAFALCAHISDVLLPTEIDDLRIGRAIGREICGGLCLGERVSSARLMQHFDAPGHQLRLSLLAFAIVSRLLHPISELISII